MHTCGRRFSVGRKSRGWADVNINGAWTGFQGGRTEPISTGLGLMPTALPGFCLPWAAVVPAGAARRLPSQDPLKGGPGRAVHYLGTWGRDRSDFYFNGFNSTPSVLRWISFHSAPLLPPHFSLPQGVRG